MKKRERIKYRGMFIPADQIDLFEQMHGGKFVFDERLGTVLEKAVHEHLRRTGHIPDMLSIKEDPMAYYKPVRVSGEVLNLGIRDVPTNAFVFIKIRRIFPVA